MGVSAQCNVTSQLYNIAVVRGKVLEIGMLRSTMNTTTQLLLTEST